MSPTPKPNPGVSTLHLHTGETPHIVLSFLVREAKPIDTYLGLLLSPPISTAMAPRKAKPQPQQPSVLPTTTTASIRVTRGAAKRAADDYLAESVAAVPEKKTKKLKGAANEKQKRQPPKDPQEKAEAESGNAGDASKRTIVIEHWYVRRLVFWDVCPVLGGYFPFCSVPVPLIRVAIFIFSWVLMNVH